MKLKYHNDGQRAYLIFENGDLLGEVSGNFGCRSSAEIAKDIVRMYNKGLGVAKDDLTEMQGRALGALQLALSVGKVHGLLDQLQGAYLTPDVINGFCAGVKEMFEANGGSK